MQAGVILRTLIDCGMFNSTDPLDVLEQIQGSFIGSGEPPGMHDTIYSEERRGLKEHIEHDVGEGEEGSIAMRRLERTRLGGGDFVKSFPDLPDAERRTSAEVINLFEQGLQGEIEFEETLFEHVEVVVTDVFRTIGAVRTRKDATSSSSAEESSTKRVEPVVIPKNLKDIEKALDGCQKATKLLLAGDKVKNIPYKEYANSEDYEWYDDEDYDGHW